MTAFTLINGTLLAMIIVWVVRPLLRETTANAAGDRRQRRVFAVALSILMPTLALAMYSALGGTDFGSPRRQAPAEAGMGDRPAQLPGGASGAPQARRGDFFGATERKFVADQAAGEVRVLIDRIVQ